MRKVAKLKYKEELEYKNGAMSLITLVQHGINAFNKKEGV